MSETTVVPEEPATRGRAQSGAPTDLLAQMQQMLAALNADLVQLDAALQAPPPGAEPA